ncbi:unnamed protein product [Spirodela intermedia]|uniref:Uncharacterized protein n=1 Tax=Spirodela intermedia TaxID=51605 RepID=A0A7I8KAZ3_SPIIN|nr:unnamed protein product [Spirodela intermedia]
MINNQHMLTYLYLLVYILLSSGVILYNKVKYLYTFLFLKNERDGTFGNTAYLHISVAFIQMLKALTLCGVVMYNYLKVKDVGASGQASDENIPERATKDWRLDKRSSDLFSSDSMNRSNTATTSGDYTAEEEAPLLPSSRISHVSRNPLSSHTA